MARFYLQEIAKAVNGNLIQGKEAMINGVLTDSRNIKRGCAFVAIKGDRFDGHSYVESAFKQGARAAIVSKNIKLPDYPDKAIIKVKDGVLALQEIAAYHRNRFKALTLVAVTGSNGKTTVKEMVTSVLAQKYKTLKTEGNLNNHIGVPLTLLGLTKAHQAAVIEMGMNAPGEISDLARITRPGIGVITNIGPAHLGKLGSISAVRSAKAELLGKIDRNGIAILNMDDPNSLPLIKKHKGKTITFGKDGSADIQLVDSWVDQNVSYRAVVYNRGKETEIHIPLTGKHNIQNALAAFAVGIAVGVEPADIVKGIKKTKAAKGRMRVERLKNGVTLIDDTYNANPASVKAAIETAAEMKKDGRLFLVFGDMLELGKTAIGEHKKIAKVANTAGVDYLYTVGKLAARAAETASALGIHSVAGKSHNSMARLVFNRMKAKDIIVVKGSRGSAMEKFIARLKELIEG